MNFQLITTAVLAGASHGAIWVDDLDRSQTAFMTSPEGCFLAGDAGNDVVNQALNELIVGDILTRARAIALICHPDAWETRIDVVLAGLAPNKQQRMHYVFQQGRVAWQAQVPSGMSIERLDEDLLSQPGLTIPEHVTGWIQNNWQSVAGFLRNGFGFCTMHGDRIVSWSLADCIVGNACEIGIHTAADYRRRGLARLTVAATVDYCLSRGLTAFGWQCHAANSGSRGVAEKVGFVPLIHASISMHK